MGTGFREFPQIPRGRVFSLLGFYALFKCFTMLRFALGLEWPFDQFQSLEPRCWILKPMWIVRDCPRADVGS